VSNPSIQETLLETNSIYVFSYPKSGRTYLRYIIGKYFQLKYNLVEYDILDYSKKALKYDCKYDLKFSHGSSYPDENLKDENAILPSDIGNSRIIWLKRNIYDTVVSQYFQQKYRKNRFKGTISEFIKSDRGIDEVTQFTKEMNKVNCLMTITYEDDLCKKPYQTCETILNYMIHSIDNNLLKLAVEESTFDKMKEAEISGRVPLSDKSYIDKSDERQLKVRRGIVGGYKDYLSEKDIEYIDEKFYNYN